MYASERLRLTPQQYLGHLVTLTQGLIASGEFNQILGDRGSDCQLVISDLAHILLDEMVTSTNRLVSKHPEKFTLPDPNSELPLD